MMNPDATPPKVTVMIPTFRQAKLVGQAIDSALAQDYPNIEVVVADDASPDDTRAVVTARNDPRLLYHRNPVNLGRVANYRHALYELATGAWVVNLDGDDYFTDPGFLSAAIALAAKDASVVMVAARRSELGHASNPQPPTQVPKNGILGGLDVLLGMPARPYHFSHMATLYRRDAALALDFYRMDVISADWESLYRLAVSGRVGYLDRIIGIWRAGDTNASRSMDWKTRAENLRIWNSIFAAAEAFSPACRALARARRETIKFFSYLGFSDVLSRGGSGAAVRYLRQVWQDDRWAGAWLLADPRCVIRLALTLLRIHPGVPTSSFRDGAPLE